VARSVVGDGRDHVAELAAAVALEDGVRPLVSDWVDELGEVISVVVKRTADPEPAVAHLLAPAGEDRPRVSVVSDPATVDITIDGLLADGRPYEIFMPEGRYVSLGTVGADGQYLEVMGRGMTIDNLLAVIVHVTVDLTAIERLPDGWVELGSAPVPPWHHGFGTYYTFEGGRRLGITVEQASPGRAALTAFAPTEAVDLGTDGWAYRHRPPDNQVWFERGDTVVHLTGDFSDTEFLLVIHSLREMRPGEHPLSDPDPYPF
jgi:hypothetical protein